VALRRRKEAVPVTYEIPGATQRFVDVNDVTLSVYESGPADGPAVVLSHGFPELAYSWRHQLPVLGDAGYHVIAPDQRGYGGSSHPGPVHDYDIFHLTGDLAALLGGLGHDKAVFVGHDWGGLVVWQMALLHPERVDGVIGVNTPFFPRPQQSPIELLRMVGGENHYIVRFQEPGVADQALAADVPGVFRNLMRRGVPPAELAGRPPVTDFDEDAVETAEPPGEPLLDDAELAVYVEEFTRTGFTGGLSWYRNMERNWEETPEQEGATIDVPSLMITAEWDPVLTPAMAEHMPALVADLEMHQIEKCGHWTQQEEPDRLNELLLDWLTRRFPPAGR
jgi:pimeloyl-ACP methyl ester carboxylesterase